MVARKPASLAARLSRPRSLRLSAAALTLLVAGSATLFHAPAALACSFAGSVIEHSYPARGALDIPTNAVLFAQGQTVDADEIELVRDDLVVMKIDVVPVAGGGFDVRPVAELEPNRGYALTAKSNGDGADDRIEFTTGAGPASLPAELPAPELAVIQVSYQLGSCGTLSSFCVDTRVPEGTELEVRMGDGMLDSGDSSAEMFAPFSRGLVAGECLTAQLRDVRGNRSAPTTLCGSVIPKMNLGEYREYSCPTTPVAWQLAAAGDSSGLLANGGGGCALSGAPRAPVSLVGVIAVTALAQLRRRRAKAPSSS